MALVDIVEWNNAYNEIRALEYYEDYRYYKCTDRMLKALGDAESAALEFLKGLDDEANEYLYSFDEEILEKFHSDEMKQFIEVEVVQRERKRVRAYIESKNDPELLKRFGFT